MFGFPKDPFGSVMITNVGSLGIDVAWAPLCPYTRVPLLLTVGAISEKPWVVDGKVEVRPIMPIAVTFDHRLIDGIHAAQMAKTFKELFADPEKLLLAD
jgi:pyruvate dehydrogenase E2 component (dihydrolipoamide acetyltransferase)